MRCFGVSHWCVKVILVIVVDGELPSLELHYGAYNVTSENARLKEKHALYLPRSSGVGHDPYELLCIYSNHRVAVCAVHWFSFLQPE